MPLEEVVDSLEGIDEQYQDLYTKNDEGKYEINITGMKSALQKEREARKQYEKELKKKGEDKTDEELKQQLNEAQSTIKNMKIESTLKNSAVKSGIDKYYVEDVVALTKNKFNLDEEGNVIRVDKDGNPTGKKVDDFFEIEFKKSKPRFYNNSGRQGGGASANVGNDVGTPDGELQKAKQNKDLNKLIRLKQNQK